LGRSQPDEYPDLSDGLLFLQDHGFEVTIEDSTPLLLNPLARLHELYSGLDPVRAARIAVRAGRYDALVCIGEATAFVFLRLKRLFNLRLPIVLVDPALGGGYARRERLLDYVLPRVDRVVVFGRVQVDYLRQVYGGRVDAVFLHHRADTVFYRPMPPAESPPRMVFSIGNDISRDFETLARAAQLHARSGRRKLRFVVQTALPCSNGGGLLDVQREPISYRRLRELYAEAAVVVVPLFNSRHAGGINALVEAMAMARPIVVSGSPGLGDYVEDGSTALVVEPGSAEAMARAIDRLVDDDAGARELGDRARAHVVERCANPAYARAMAEQIRDVVQRASGDASEPVLKRPDSRPQALP
jgi:glycosyltransferase involved in cell wall biosynthesis